MGGLSTTTRYTNAHTWSAAGALGALGAYVDQVSAEQGAEGATGVAAFARSVQKSPMQSDGISCGVCVLVEIQRVAGEDMISQRAQKFAEAKLLRCKAKWACELLLNSAPPSQGGRGDGLHLINNVNNVNNVDNVNDNVVM